MNRRMTLRAISACCALTGLLLGATTTNGQESQSELSQALRDGSFNLVFRYRYELVDQDGIDADANANTLKSRLTYRSANYKDWSLLLEVDDLRPIGPGHFNSTRNGQTDRPGVVDPRGTDLNQGAIIYTGFADTEISFGRQRIAHANQRYIGGVPWRQNEQTYDALEFTRTISDSSQVRYAYIRNVNTIFGPDSGSPPGDRRSSSHLLDASHNFGSAANLMGFAYLLDFDDAPALSSQTLGLRLTGAPNISDNLTFPYVAEFASQEDHADNPNSFDMDHYVLEAGLGFSGYIVKLGYEVFAADTTAGVAFQTILGTNHAFQGWADKFLTTPTGGIEDAYIQFNGRIGKFNVTAAYHDFEADTGGDYGDEINIQAAWPFANNYALLLKYASYNSDGFATDTDKFWLQLTASF